MPCVARNLKWILGAWSLLCAAFSVYSWPTLQSHYTRVEAYEIRPGLLGIPKYAEDSTLCEISLEKRHVQSDAVDLGATMPREVVLEIIDELAPPTERGKPLMQLAGSDYIDAVSGSTSVSLADYENVSVQIFRTRSQPGDIAAIVKWKTSACTSRT